MVSTCLGCSIGIAIAAPDGGTVSGGLGSISQNGSSTTIHQSSDRLLIDWNSFNVGSQETVRFYQPGSQSIAINRIHDGNPSTILGSLSANGQVMLINPNGVLFGNGSQIDVGSLVVSTASPTEQNAQDFIAGRTQKLDLSVAGNPQGLILNAGTITAKEAGLVGFVAPNVINNGVIIANAGTVQLQSGSMATLDLYGDGLIDIAVSNDVKNQLVEQNGWVQADGGKVIINAAAGEEIVNSVINMTGITQARSIEQKNGKIILSAEGSNAVKNNIAANKGKKSGASVVLVSGVLDASGRKPGERGGEITITGDYIGISQSAFLDASGYTGASGTTTVNNRSAYRPDAAGGDIRIGGDYLGTGTTAAAKGVYIEEGALILNDAIHSGDGGRTIIWSDGDTYFYGNILARGGAQGGDGGFVETSGHGYLDAQGYVDLTAENGVKGTYLLDPTNIVIYGNVDPAFQSTDGSINLSSSLKLWLDAADASKVTLTYSTDALSSAAVTKTGGNTFETTTNLDLTTSLQVGARVRLNSAGAVTTADTMGADTFTIASITYDGSKTIITTSETISGSYTGSTLYRGLVSQLTDKSGQANTATQSTEAFMPLWVSNGQNGKGVLKFDGINDRLQSPVSITSPISIFSAYNVDVFQNYGVVYANALTNNFQLGTAANYPSGQNSNYYHSVTYGGSRLILNNPGTSAYLNYANWNGSTLSYNVNGNYLTGSHANTDTTLNGLWIGGRSSNDYINGKIYETIIYNSNLSGDSRNVIEQYQSAKWGIALTAPGTGGTEVEKATAADGYSVFTTRYLERLSQTADIALQASNNITLDLKGDTLALNNNRSITLTAGSDITSASNGTMTTSGSGNITLAAGQDINFANDLDLTALGSGSVTLQANRNILYSGSGDITTNGGHIVLNSDRDATNGGAISLQLGSNLTSISGNITLGGGTDPTVTHAIGTASYIKGVLLQNNTIDAGTGSISIHGTGYSSGADAIGVHIDRSTVKTTGNGAITMVGTATTSSGIHMGIWSGGGTVNSLISAENGAIDLTGSTVAGNGIYLGWQGLSTIRSTGNGNITLTGTAGSGNTKGGIYIDSVSATHTAGIYSKNGDLTLIAIGGTGTNNHGINGTGSYSAPIGDANTTGKITLITTSIGFATAPTMRTTGDIIIRPYTPGTAINIAGSGGLGLSSAFLNNLTYGGTLWLGGYGNPGDADYISNAGNFTLNPYAFNGNVHIMSAGDIISGSAGSITNAANKNITLSALNDINITHDFDLTALGSGSVTLQANRHILYSGSGDITTNGGHIILNSDRDATNGGAISLGTGTALTSNGGNITLGGGADPTATHAIGVGSYARGIDLSGVMLDARGSVVGGTISLRGLGDDAGTSTVNTTAPYGLALTSSTVQTDKSGSIYLRGEGGGTSGGGTSYGIGYTGTNTITSHDGDITVYGLSNILRGISGRANYEATGIGNLTVTGIGSSSGQGYGIDLFTSYLTRSGKITITGYGGAGGLSNGGGSPVIGNANTTGRIEIITDKIGFSILPVIRTTGDIIIRPYTPGTTIGIGAVAGLQLSTEFLNNLTWGGNLWLGGYGHIGDAGYINNAGNMSFFGSRSFNGHVNFMTAGNVSANGPVTITANNNSSISVNALGNIQTPAYGITFNAAGTGNVSLTAGGNISSGFSASSQGGNIILTAGDYISTGGNTYSTTGYGYILAKAANSVTFNNAITQLGSITLHADSDVNGTGGISTGNLVTGGGNITLGGGSNPTTDYSTGDRGVFIANGNLNANGGNIIVNGKGWASDSSEGRGVLLFNAQLSTSGNGKITINAVGGGLTSSKSAFDFGVISGSSLSAVNGDITVNGTLTVSGGTGYSIVGAYGGSISTSGTGNINIVSQDFDNTNRGYHGDSITITSGNNITFAGNKIYTNGGNWNAAGDITIRPYSAGTTVGIGSGSGTLTLADAFLNKLTWGNTLWLGGYGLTGLETGYWNASGNMTLNSTRSFGKNVNFLSGADILSGANSTITLTNAASTVLWALNDINITHDLDFTATGTGSVTLRANRNIVYSGSGDIITNGGHITLNSDRDGSTSGAIFLGSGSDLISNGGNVTLGGGTDPTTGYAYGNSTYKRGIQKSGSINAEGTSSGGNIILNGYGWADASCSNDCFGIANSVSTTTSTSHGGTILLDGVSGGTSLTSDTHGMQLSGSFSTVNGNITLQGTALGNSTGGAISSAYSTIQTTGTGNVNLISRNSGSQKGLNIWQSASISSGNNITFTGNRIGNDPSFYINYLSLSAVNDIVIRPYTPGTSIGVSGGTLSIIPEFLNKLSYGGTLWLGGYGNPGDAGYVSNAGNFTLNPYAFKGHTHIMSAGDIISGSAGSITNTANKNFTLSALGGINFGHALTTTLSGTGAFTAQSANDMTLSAITTAGGSVTATATGAGKLITTSSIATGTNGNITLTADDIDIGGNLSGTGVLTLQPYSATRHILLGMTYDSIRLNLSTSDLGHLSDGWSRIYIGREDSRSISGYETTTSWSDPVTFRTIAGQTINLGQITGTGNASFAFETDSVNFHSITTNNGSITFSKDIAFTNTPNHSITTNGGDIFIARNLRGAQNQPYNVNFNAGTGNVYIGGTVTSFSASPATTWTMSGNSLTLNGVWGTSLVPLNNVTLNSVNSLSLPTIYSANLNVTVSGAGNSITAPALAAGTSGNITFTADDLILNGDLSGTGTLTLQPYSTSRVVRINYGSDNGSFFYLSTAEIGRLIDGWAGINIGRIDATVDSTIGTSTWTDPVTFRSAYRIHMYGLTGTGNASFAFTGTGTGWVDSFSNITTAGGSIDFGGMSDLYLAGNSTYTTNNGSIILPRLSGTTTNLNLNAGSGTIAFGNTVNSPINITATGSAMTFNGAWGGTTPLGNVTLTSANSITLPAITTAAGKTVAITATGAGKLITTSSIATGTDGHITLTSDDIDIGGNLSGTGTLTLQPYAQNRAVRINYSTDNGSVYHLNATEISNLSNGWNLINLGRTDGSSNGYIMGGNTTWYDPVNFRNANTMAVLGNLTGQDNASFVFTTSRSSVIATISTAGGSVTFGEVSYLNGGGFSVATNNGNITIGSMQPTHTQTLPVNINLNAGNGLITFNGTVNASANSPIINVTASANSIVFNGAWGTSLVPLNNVTLTSVNSLSLPTIYSANLNVTVSGAGNSITAPALTAGTSGIITFTADDLILNGDLSGTGTLTLQPYSTSRIVNINRGTADGTNFNLSTAEIGRLSEGWSNIAIGRSDGLATLYVGTSTWSDPVTFRNNFLQNVNTGATITGTDNASFVFDNGWVDLRGTITTAGRSVSFTNSNNDLTGNRGYIFSYDGSILTHGGQINMRNFFVRSGTSHNINSDNGNIIFSGRIGDVGDTSGYLLNINAGTGSISFGDIVNGRYSLTALAGTMTFSGAWGGNIPLGTVSLTSTNSLSLPSITASSIFARTTGTTSDITIASGRALTSSGSNGITLVAARDFINQAGSSALSSGGSGRWLVYSTNVTGTTGEQDLANNFVRYNCSYAGGCAAGVSIPTSGNGFIYSYTPVLTATPTVKNVTYGDAITGLSGYAYSLSGYNSSADLSADIITGTLTGTTDYTIGADVDTYHLNYSSGSLASALGYNITYADNGNGINVTPRVLTTSLTGNVTKIYDGDANAALTVGNYILSNIYNNDDVGLGNITAGTYDDKNVASGKTVSVSGLFLGGTKASNYVLASSAVSGDVGVITPKGLTVTATAGQNKTYGQSDGTLAYTYDGLTGGDLSASFTGSLSRNGTNDAGIYAITQGNLTATGNYVIDSFVSNNYTINKAAISITAPGGSRYYGYDNPNYDWSHATIVGLQYGQNGSVLDNLTFNIAGTATQTAGVGTTHAITLGGFSDNNYTLNSFTGGMLTINKAPLTIRADNKMRVVVMPMPTLTATFSGLRNGETSAVVSGLNLGTTDYNGAPIGSYAITASGGTSANYDITYVAGTMTVTPGALPNTIINPKIIVQTNSDDSINTSLLSKNNDSSSSDLFNPSGFALLTIQNNSLAPLTLHNMPLVTFTPELRAWLDI